jgi:three-Cys-motif partner protein
MAPSETLWELDPHTVGKHLVLRAYLNAWLPIMSSANSRVLFIDGFAGPGEYKGGEEGSPQIALRALVDHSAEIKAEVVYWFIEKETDRSEHLETVVDEWRTKLPKSTKVEVVEGSFDDTMKGIFDYLDEQQRRLAPAFVMIDPFGVAGTPMSIVRRLLKNPRCEIYFSLMWEPINRFATRPEFKKHLDELFGCEDWKDLVKIEDTEQRREALYNLYEEQLRDAGAKHVIHFDIFDGNRLKYSIFFASQHEVGADRMKQAIWKVAPDGDFAFRGSKTPQLELTASPNFEPLMDQLIAEFGDGEWHDISEILNFVMSDATDYHSGQVKKKTLKPMEQAHRVQVDPATRKRGGTYPDGCRLKFLPHLKSYDPFVRRPRGTSNTPLDGGNHPYMTRAYTRGARAPAEQLWEQDVKGNADKAPQSVINDKIKSEISKVNVGRIAERIVANELEFRGFRVSDLNSDGTAANADLLAVSPNLTLQVQVKGAANGKGPWWVEYGFCTHEIMADRRETMFNRKNSFYKANFIVLVAVRSAKDYCCIVLPVAEAERLAQLNIEREYRTPTKAGEPKKPHKVWVALEPRPRARASDARYSEERAVLANYRDEQGWARLLP